LGGQGACTGADELVFEAPAIEGEGQAPPPPLEILTSPPSAALYVGMPCKFTVATSGGVAAVQYDWRKDGVSLDAPSRSDYTIAAIGPDDAGTYTCVVSDGVSTLETTGSVLTVYPAPATGYHSADTNQDWSIGLPELLRAIQFFNSGGLHCASGTEDGYAPGPGAQGCAGHQSDYNPQDWSINLSELLRLIQFYNAPGGAYHIQSGTEDNFDPQAG
jgi:hypothetical protein